VGQELGRGAPTKETSQTERRGQLSCKRSNSTCCRGGRARWGKMGRKERPGREAPKTGTRNQDHKLDKKYKRRRSKEMQWKFNKSEGNRNNKGSDEKRDALGRKMNQEKGNTYELGGERIQKQATAEKNQISARIEGSNLSERKAGNGADSSTRGEKKCRGSGHNQNMSRGWAPQW